MAKKMLIDATHAEETRVAVLDGNRLVDFDYESKFRKPLKGNIFLAKVTRVEPSLQAAFVNFGGNRHGFLPFTEIHPDYFRIPIADREALIAEELAELEARKKRNEEEDLEHEDIIDDEAEEVEDVDDEDHEIEEIGGSVPMDDLSESEDITDNKKTVKTTEPDSSEAVPLDEDVDLSSDSEVSDTTETSLSDEASDASDSGDQDDSEDKNDKKKNGKRRYPRRNYRGKKGKSRRYSSAHSRRVERVGGEEIEQPYRPSIRRKYKIQEVIKRGQIMLIQASKEERGNKGAAVTTYLSLPGRYSVLMPNSPRGGGVSRKIASVKERKRMREILEELEVPEGMSVIMRTAGVSRTKSEIKRDLDYLMRIWNKIRELTLNSTAPAMVYEEGNLLKRSIRDIYTRDVDEILVSGEEGYKESKDFMKMLIPSHAKKVKFYKDNKIPLYQRYQAESQISDIGEPTASLKSGGYLVINPTEALVSIDVNSGRATKERHIEETALNTNLEAADEVARQLRLRDLGGLVVIDFIDMEDYRNNRKVERRLKEALSSDRARIQIGRISSFGLMELSRQRLNPSLTEAQFEACPHCRGLGYRRTVDAMAIMVLRALEEEGGRERSKKVALVVSNDVALFILNSKRQMLADIEERYGISVLIRVEKDLPASDYRIELLKVEETPVEKDESKEDPDEDGNQKNKNRSARSSNNKGNTAKRGRKTSRSRYKQKDKNEQATAEDEPQDVVAETQTDTDTGTDIDGKERKPAKKRPTRRRPQKKDDSKKEIKEGHDETAESRPAQNKEVDDVKESRKDNKTSQKTSSARRTQKKKVEKDENPPSPDSTKKKTDEKGDEKSVSVSKKAEKQEPKEYETVNKEPAQKKKGWWGRLVE